MYPEACKREDHLPHDLLSLKTDTVTAEVMQYRVNAVMSNLGIAGAVNLREYKSAVVDGLIYELTAYILGRRDEDRAVRYPDGPWEALKERYAPAWIKRRWPVKMVSTPTYFVCPHLPCDPRRQHINFIVYGNGRAC